MRIMTIVVILLCLAGAYNIGKVSGKREFLRTLSTLCDGNKEFWTNHKHYQCLTIDTD